MVERARLPEDGSGSERERGRRPLKEVLRRDGQREAFDPARLADSIHRAAAAVGQGEALLAEELAALVALVIEEETSGGIPTTRALRETAERVLMETGHHDVARSYILLHARESGGLVERSSRADPTSGRDGLMVASLGRECLEAFDAARVANSLMVDCALSSADANAVASAVESKVRAHAGDLVTAATVRELVACELLARARVDLLPRVQGLGVPAPEVESIAFARGGGERAEVRIGGELLRRYSLARLLDPPVAAAHLGGDLHVDGLCAPGRALDATIDFGDVRRAVLPGAVAGLLHLVHGLEPLLHGTLALHHIERALATAFEEPGRRAETARLLLLALAEGNAGRAPGGTPRRILGVGADLPPGVAAALFRRGAVPEAVRLRLQGFVTDLLEQAVAFAPHLKLPRIRLLLTPGDEERELTQLSAALQPALALGVADVQHDNDRLPAVQVVGARVGLNVARRALKAGRRREGELVRQLKDLVECGLSAGANVLRNLLQRDELGLGFLGRLRELSREVGRDLPLELPGRHVYQLVLVPVGIDAAVRAITEREPSESEAASRLRDDLLAALREALPPMATSATRFVLSEQSFPEAELRFGRLDWLAFPRLREVIGLAHDGAAFRYSFDPAPPAMAMAAAVAGTSVRSSRPSAGVEAP